MLSSVVTGLAHHWNLDEGPDWHDNAFESVCSVSTANDAVGTGHATLMNMEAESWVSGQQFTSLVFDGTDDYLSVACDLDAILSNTSSLALWIQTSQVGGSTAGTSPGIAGYSNTENDGIQWGWLDDVGRMSLSVGDTLTVRTLQPINDGRWHFIVFTRDADSGAAKVYVDGELSNSGVGPAGTVTTSFTSLGRIEDSTGSHRFFQGVLDQIYVFDRIIDREMVEQLCDNYAPKASYVSAEAISGEPSITPSMLLGAFDVENDSLRVVSFTPPVHGTATDNGDGTFVYTANTDFTGSDSFEVTIEDGRGGFSVAVMSLRVQATVDTSNFTAEFENLAVINTDGSPIAIDSLRVPRAADWDGDGLEDLLFGGEGNVWMYHNVGDSQTPLFEAGIRLTSPFPVTNDYVDFQAVEANELSIILNSWQVPRAIDWDQDDLMDLLVGAEGSIWLYRNIGTNQVPAFDTGVRVLANGVVISSGTDQAPIALADMTGDGVTDLMVVDSQNKVRVYANTSSAGQVPVYAVPTYLQDTTGSDMVLADKRFDIGDWNNDGLPDIVVGTFAGDAQVFLNLGTATSPTMSTNGITILNEAYNVYPRLMDISNNGTVDLIRAFNWGEIRYWLDPAQYDGVLNDTPSGVFSVTDTGGSNVNFHALCDGAIVDFADFNNDGVLDMITGGHSGENVYIAYGCPCSITDYISDIETIYDAHPNDLGTMLWANGGELLTQMRNATQGIINLMRVMTLGERQQMYDEFATHVSKYAFLRLQQLDTGIYHTVPSIVAQDIMILHHMLPDTPNHRENVADVFGMTGLHREIFLEWGIVVGDNVQCSQGQLESLCHFFATHPRQNYPDNILTIDHFFGDGSDGIVDGFDGWKNTFSNAVGSASNEWATDLNDAILAVKSEANNYGDIFTFVVGHEATHSLDGYVRSRANSDLQRRWGQILVLAAGTDVVAAADGWIDWNATKDHFEQTGLWNPGTQTWDEAWDNYWTIGTGADFRHPSFMRGSIDWFLENPQESLATQANQHWVDSEGRIIGAVDRFGRGYTSNLSEVLTFLDFLSIGMNRIPMFDIDAGDGEAIWNVSYANLQRNNLGYITRLYVNGHVYEFEVDEYGIYFGVVTHPTVISIARAGQDPTNASSVDYTVTFSEEVSGVDAYDFTLFVQGEMTDTHIASVLPYDDSSTVYTVTVATGSGDGTIRLDVIENGTITDQDGDPLDCCFMGAESYTIDRTAPRIIESSIFEGDTFMGSTLVYELQFDESLLFEEIDPSDWMLEGIESGYYAVDEFSYDSNTSTLCVTYRDLTEDEYTFHLYSGNGQFEDVARNWLDGEINPSTTVPTGEGQSGGDFTVHFSVVTSAIPGDASLDGTVDVSDLGILAKNYGTSSGAKWGDADFTGDGMVDVCDLGILASNYGISIVPEWIPGDANKDGMVDVSDLGILAANYGINSGAEWSDADFTGDGMVNVSDLGILAANYGTVAVSTSNTMASLATSASEPEMEIVPCDLDNDGQVGLGDLAFFSSVYGEQPGITTDNPCAYAADFDRSGTVALADLGIFSSHYRQGRSENLVAPQTTLTAAETPASLPGIESTDASVVATNRQKQSAAVWRERDFNGNNKVTDDDVAILARHWMIAAANIDDDEEERDAVFAATDPGDDWLGLFDE
ncbi:MAG: cadherin-like domain-containing protein [Pirellulales bacterium]|nr:cadherin-like domain-containing protein [Pirellulales bacterium]